MFVEEAAETFGRKTGILVRYKSCSFFSLISKLDSSNQSWQTTDHCRELLKPQGHWVPTLMMLERIYLSLWISCQSHSYSYFKFVLLLVAKETDYRPKGKEGFTCVLFIVMSYGRPGLIQCHKGGTELMHPYVEQKDLQEAFQPQHNPSLALKPKLFIIQVCIIIDAYLTS